ncbi:MAG: hypothetical protein M0006_09405 [Magnetospirillum sp.]|nr:hypothetical protein [Magnetospirillum sp.]
MPLHCRDIRVALTTALLSCAASASAFAGMNDIRSSDNAVFFSVGGSYMDYWETDATTGRTADSERGWLPTVRAGADVLASNQARGPLRNLYLHVDTSVSTGSTAYKGALLDGTPYSGTTNDTIWTTSGRIGRAFALGSQAMLIPFAELGYRRWDRDVGYTEIYDNWSMMGGLLAQYSPVAKWVISASAAAGTTFDANMHANGPFNAEFNLGDELTWRVGGQVGYAVTRRLEAITSVELTRLGFGSSPAVATDQGYFYEPNSQTYQTTLMVGLAYHFF